MSESTDQQKSHRPRQSGAKFTKKKKAQAQASLSEQRAKAQRNPKAFTCQSGIRAEKNARRNVELQEKRLHVPMVDRSSLEPPPMIVAVVGPPSVGKSTLIRCLVKRFTKHNLNDIKGPITVVAGKKRRITFLECENNINAMVDVAKIADLVLLMIDGSFGFEMETFEFLNILQSHGFPKVIGVLTHLDGYKDNKKLKKTKKKLKQRFWTEIYDGAKLFYLSGMINGKYLKNEIMNLSRFISIMKFRPLVWRNQHPYLLVDRLEDLTNPEEKRVNPKINRKVSVYGYVRGTQFKPDQKIHIPGVGDQVIKEISLLDDPCPLPKKFNDPMSKSRRSLNDKERLLYAPMNDVTGILYDKDAVYINIPDSIYRPSGGDENADAADPGANSHLDEGDNMLKNLQKASATMDENLDDADLQIFQDSAPIKSHEIVEDGKRQRRRVLFGDENESNDEGEDDDDDEDEDEEEDEDALESGEEDETNLMRGPNEESGDEKLEYYETDSDLDSDDGEVAEWKKHLSDNLKANLQTKRVNIMNQVYGLYDDEGDEDEEDEDFSDAEGKVSKSSSDPDALFYKVNDVLEKKQNISEGTDNSLYRVKQEHLEKFNDDAALEKMRRRFITGEAAGSKGTGNEDEEEAFGDFEDLETGEKHDSGPVVSVEEQKEIDLAKKKELLKMKFDEEYDGKELEEEDEDKKDETFYDKVKSDMQKQKDLNREVLAQLDVNTRLQLEGFSSGYYVRIILEDVPCEMIENFSPYYPVILGGLLNTEEKFGFVQVRIKRHRWFRKILKTNDPLIISLGWRRFQTLPIYSICTDGQRNRMLKYTPEHMHCLATFYGPITPVNTGFCAVQTVSQASSNFRICATGVICDMNQSTEIVKKLKLTGTPFKVMKKTAFIRDMFSSALEVAKFEGASIRTVSGLRGQIKKAVRLPEGGFRATFEDKILISDIVFLRTWYPVVPKAYYNPVTSLLLSDKNAWQGMRLTRDVRKEKGVAIPSNPDSHYKKIERPNRRFNSLKIPRKLQADLPFSSKPKLLKAKGQSSRKNPGYLEKRTQIQEPEDQRASRLLTHLTMIQREKERKRKVKNMADRQKYLKRKAEEDEESSRKEKEKKKRIIKAIAKKRGNSEI